MPDPRYIRARAVLLDAVDALNDHLDAVVLVGAQAIYLHTGDGDLLVAPYTTDADFCLSPKDLADHPKVDELLTAGGFTRERDPGRWISPDGIYIDIMVPEAVAGTGSRSADIAPHAKNTARRALGLEGALVDRDRTIIESLDSTDPRTAELWVAGPGALLVAKIHKVNDRTGANDRVRNKDVLDILRLLRAIDTPTVVDRITLLLKSDLANAVTSHAIELMPSLFGDLRSPGIEMLRQAVGTAEDPDTVAVSLVVLVEDLVAALK